MCKWIVDETGSGEALELAALGENAPPPAANFTGEI